MSLDFEAKFMTRVIKNQEQEISDYKKYLKDMGEKLEKVTAENIKLKETISSNDYAVLATMTGQLAAAIISNPDSFQEVTELSDKLGENKQKIVSTIALDQAREILRRLKAEHS